MEDQGAELAELRRRAYSRAGTEDDRRRLAQLESAIVAPPPMPAESVAEDDAGSRVVPAELDELDESDDETPPAPVRPSRWVAGGAGAVAGAALATAVTLAAVALSSPVEEPESAPALAVFEREALGIDDPSNLLFPLDSLIRDAEGTLLADAEDVTLRWVGAAAERDVYAVRWQQGGEYTICLVVEAADQAGVACTPEADFIENGVRMYAFGVELRWGPSDTKVWFSTLT